MAMRACLLLTCLLMARAASAGTIVTWQSVGEIVVSTFHNISDTGLTPPVGTPYELQMNFDPSALSPTPLSAAGSNCYTVGVSGSVAIGGYTYGLSGNGFTHGKLPGSACSPGWMETQFLLGVVDAPPASPWVLGLGFMEAWYVDTLVKDAFPLAPTSNEGMGFQIRDFSGSFLVRAHGDLQAVDVEQPTPVPEPGTLALFGLGLAAVARRVRQTHG